MNKIIYYVATSLDGYISGPNEDITGFVAGGNGVQQYLDDLKEFKTVIMGKNTYEFGYKYGLEPGKLAYPHMDHFIFSSSLSFQDTDDKMNIKPLSIEEVLKIKDQSETDVYLCGGGTFAGWLLDHEMIDVLKLKINPLILGDGIRLFGNSTKRHLLKLTDSKQYDDGLLINTYSIKY